MKATKQQIVNGAAEYIRDAIIPHMGGDRAMQIMASVALNAVKANDKLADKVFEHELIKTLLEDDGSGRYEIGKLLDQLKASIEQYGALPIEIPKIPLISKDGSTITLNAADIDAIRQKIMDQASA